MTAEQRFETSPNLMTSLNTARKRRQQLHAHDVRGLAAFCFVLWKKKVNKLCFPSIFKVQTVFTPISNPDKYAMLLKTYFKPPINKVIIYER